ncbi:hypothetical protein C8F01DRAFT_1254250 [Mycena amicta]|nr:hypothetical protein C8F01DRAFT_1254250 [Mycena amicta]
MRWSIPRSRRRSLAGLPSRLEHERVPCPVALRTCPSNLGRLLPICRPLTLRPSDAPAPLNGFIHSIPAQVISLRSDAGSRATIDDEAPPRRPARTLLAFAYPQPTPAHVVLPSPLQKPSVPHCLSHYHGSETTERQRQVIAGSMDTAARKTHPVIGSLLPTIDRQSTQRLHFLLHFLLPPIDLSSDTVVFRYPSTRFLSPSSTSAPTSAPPPVDSSSSSTRASGADWPAGEAQKTPRHQAEAQWMPLLGLEAECSDGDVGEYLNSSSRSFQRPAIALALARRRPTIYSFPPYSYICPSSAGDAPLSPTSSLDRRFCSATWSTQSTVYRLLLPTIERPSTHACTSPRLPNLGRIERGSAEYGGRESSATDDTDTANVVSILNVAHPRVIVPWPRYQLLLPVAFPGYVEWSARPSSFPSESRQRGYWEAFPRSTYGRHIFLDGLEALRYTIGSHSRRFLRVDLVITEVQRNESTFVSTSSSAGRLQARDDTSLPLSPATGVSGQVTVFVIFPDDCAASTLETTFWSSGSRHRFRTSGDLALARRRSVPGLAAR